MLTDIISEQTLVPIGLAVCCTVAVGGLVWKGAAILSKHASESREAMAKLEHRMELFQAEIRGALERLNVNDHVTHSEMREWVAELRAVFPEKPIPGFKHIKD